MCLKLECYLNFRKSLSNYDTGIRGYKKVVPLVDLQKFCFLFFLKFFSEHFGPSSVVIFVTPVMKKSKKSKTISENKWKPDALELQRH